MSSQSRQLALFAVIAAGLLPAAGAQAQYYNGATRQPAPLYPYAVQGNQPYAIEVVPNSYVIRRPAAARAYPYVGRRAGQTASKPKAPALDRPHKKADRALIEQLRKRAPLKRTVSNTRKIVHDAPLVVETQRVVDDPPRVIERRHVVEGAPVRSRRKSAAIADADSNKRVIEADAEVTILGRDRMNIRLFRKGQGPKANARTE